MSEIVCWSTVVTSGSVTACVIVGLGGCDLAVAGTVWCGAVMARKDLMGRLSDRDKFIWEVIGEGLYIGACLRVLLDPERLTGMKVSSSASSSASENWVRTPYLFWEESTEIFLAGISFSVGD